ncbi:MAG: biotin--[acetyl-CoA-carboxylase] ligase [Verrucomicrobia bacterium]|nr:MAG: biotin--[acetyl-CoA-carboxylase] ligase [Verrucomicrobiota bacterium]
MIEEDFLEAAADFPEPFRLWMRDELPSSHDEAMRLAHQGAAEGAIILVERQTAGRGRRGAAWFSSPKKSLAFSLILRPQEAKALWPRLALAAGLAVAEAIEDCGIQALVKWPNDVWIGERKVAGILVDAAEQFVIIGIGINVNCTEFPDEIAHLATSLCQENGNYEISRSSVLAAIIYRLAIRRQQIDADFPVMIAAIRQRCALSGRRAHLSTAHGEMFGRVLGISDAGELIFQTQDTTHHLIQAHSIQLLDEDLDD